MNQRRALFSTIFAAAALVLLGLGVGMVYEAAAIWTGAVPTISAITAGQLLVHPTWWVFGVFCVGVLLGALVTHFSHWTPAGRSLVGRIWSE